MAATHKTVELMTQLGFSINETKSVVKPTQIIEFLGFMLDSVNMKIYPTREKVRNIKDKLYTGFLIDSQCFSQELQKSGWTDNSLLLSVPEKISRLRL